mgnify:CR=1 FL=1|jgi:hypothetical protein
MKKINSKKKKYYEVGIIVTETWWFNVEATNKREALMKARNPSEYQDDVYQTCTTSGETKDSVREIKK